MARGTEARRRGAAKGLVAGLLVLVPVLVPILVLVAGGCGEVRVDDPMRELRQTARSPRVHQASMELLDARPDDPAYTDLLERIIWVHGYTVETREAALERLAVHDLDGLKKTIRQRLPQMSIWEWRKRLCVIIAEREWIDLTPALVSSWSQASANAPDARQRPEHPALLQLYGTEEAVVDVVFDVMLGTKAWQQGLRTRCWGLLHELGARDRIIDLIETASIAPDDAMLVDLRAAAADLGIVPRNREEILWIRALRKPEHAEFWSQAVAAVGGLPADRVARLHLRDVPIVVSAALHDPELLAMSEAALYAQLDVHLKQQKHFARGSSSYDGGGRTARQRLDEHRDALTWGDLAAMTIALRAVAVPQVTAHLFDYARRDRADTSAEYGGIIDLDEQGRFQVLEFPPRMRRHDQEFIAPQAMFDAGYTALFHFHNHVQKERNGDFAGPGLGDVNYADSTRANCLVFTSVGRGRLNVDFYRHDRVVVDLGVLEALSREGTE